MHMAKHEHEEIRLGGGRGGDIRYDWHRIDGEVISLEWGMDVQHDQRD